ncbi:MAG TPA: DUF3048 domain-containing protein [Syntrophaceticus sp.]|nr:DUF3048 domain-containing protein [Syntrophaceticus sp.]
MKKRGRFLLFCCLWLLLVVSMTFVLYGCAQESEPQNPVEPPDTEVEETGVTDPLTGQKVSEVVPLIAVMVDNLGPARPQTGLGEAGVVYEMETEAKITRFMALFAGDPPSVVGPVRSARSYYLQICKEWDAIFAHVGGSKDAIANIKRWGIRDLDQFANKGEFWRDKSRKAPHNVYLNIDEATAGKDLMMEPHWRFGDLPDGDPDYQKISFNYGNNNNVTYEFAADKKRYLRYINGSPHTDRESGEQIAVTNIVLQYADHHYRGDGSARIDIQLIGSGRAEYFLAGQYQEGSWRKDSIDSPTKFFDSYGQEIIFPRGNTWVQVLRPQTAVEKL